jgi:transposase
MKPCSMDLREKVLAAVDRAESCAGVARRFGISERTVRACRRRRDRDRLEPDTPGPRGPTRLDEADHQTLLELIAAEQERPDLREKWVHFCILAASWTRASSCCSTRPGPRPT